MGPWPQVPPNELIMLLTNSLDFQCVFQALSFLGYTDHQSCLCKDESGVTKGLEVSLPQALILFCSLLFSNWKPPSTFSKVNTKVKFLQKIPQEHTLPSSLLNNHWTLTLCVSKRNKEKTQLSTAVRRSATFKEDVLAEEGTTRLPTAPPSLGAHHELLSMPRYHSSFTRAETPPSMITADFRQTRACDQYTPHVSMNTSGSPQL